MNKKYLPKPKAVSPFSEAKLEAYLAGGGTIQSCANGESAAVQKNMRTIVKAANELSQEKRIVR